MAENNPKLFVNIDVLYREHIQPMTDRNPVLLMMLEGQAELRIDGKRTIFNSNDIMCLNPGTEYSIHRITDKGKMLIAKYTITREFLINILGMEGTGFLCNSRDDSGKAEYNELRVLLKYMIKDYAINGIDRPNLMQFSDCYKLLHILTSYFMIPDSGLSWDKPGDRMEKIRDYLSLNYCNDISIEELAHRVGLTEAYLSRSFKQTFGTTPTDYLYEIRLDEARKELETTDHSLTRICLDNGFPNSSVFNNRYRERYGLTPREYRKNKRSMAEASGTDLEENEGKSFLREFFHTDIIGTSRNYSGNEIWVTCDNDSYRPYKKIWNMGINVGSAEYLLNSDVQKALIQAKKGVGFTYARIWNIFSPNLFVIHQKNANAVLSQFNRLFKAIDFLLACDMKPIIEFGEKRNSIRKNISENVRESDNFTLFKNYQHFLSVMDELFFALVSVYDKHEVASWIFELWDDRRVEVYKDKQDYITVFKDVRRILQKHIPEAKISGAGNYLGWSNQHTDDTLKRWADDSVYPNYLTFVYSPYHGVDVDNDALSTLKSDENDLSHTLDDLSGMMVNHNLKNIEGIFVCEWNMTDSSRNYFNDSLWKASYVVRTYIDCIGKVSSLLYNQLTDITTDYYDNQRLLNGSGGLITRDLIEKPAFLAMKLFERLQKYIICKGNGYIVTRDEYDKITILCCNFIERNYLYYLRPENENTLEDHYGYLANQEKKTIHFEIDNVSENSEFILHHHVINRQAGSIMDEWAKFNFLDNLRYLDIEYLKQITIPKLYYTVEHSTASCLKFEVTLEPLEVRCISIKSGKRA